MTNEPEIWMRYPFQAGGGGPVGGGRVMDGSMGCKGLREGARWLKENVVSNIYDTLISEGAGRLEGGGVCQGMQEKFT